MDTQNKTIQWLLEDENPSVQYRTLTEVLDFGEDTSEIRRVKSALLNSHDVQTLLEKMHPEGYWLQEKPHTKQLLGTGVEYGSFGTTHFCLAYLAEMGMDRSHPQVEKAVERYLSLQQADGDWYKHLSCLFAYNIRTMAYLGYREDKRIKHTIELMLRTCRKDGGYLCDIHEKKTNPRSVKSCIRGSVKALLAFAEFPQYWDHPRCHQLVDYFLKRGGIYQSVHPGVLVNKDMQRLAFPIIWRANVFEILYGLSKMGYGSDERLQKVWTFLENRADPEGRYPLDWTPTQCPWKVGQCGEANKWVTFYVEAARKYKTQRSAI
jgi:hypothetical protein